MDAPGANLRYIEADRLRIAGSAVGRASIVSPGSAVLGVLAGALIDPLRRQLSYLVVESRGWLRTRQYLVPLGTTCFDPNRRELHVDVEAHDLRDTRAKRFLRYSDDDVIAAMFAPRAA